MPRNTICVPGAATWLPGIGNTLTAGGGLDSGGLDWGDGPALAGPAATKLMTPSPRAAAAHRDRTLRSVVSRRSGRVNRSK